VAAGGVSPTSPDTNAGRLRSFRQGLKDTGYVEGENVAIQYRWAENQFDRLPANAEPFSALGLEDR
jgi:putative ABC transport system substrate-binding protein